MRLGDTLATSFASLVAIAQQLRRKEPSVIYKRFEAVVYDAANALRGEVKVPHL
jgi:hypothetical protein